MSSMNANNCGNSLKCPQTKQVLPAQNSAHAESNSRLALANGRKANEWMTNDAPFLLQSQQLNLDMLDHAQAVETLRNSTIQEQVISVLESTLEKRQTVP